MPPLLDSIILLFLIIVLARFLKRQLLIIQKLFIPSSIIAGLFGLLLGPQVMGIIPVETTAYWETFPKYLITIVFAGLFLGKFIPDVREIWRESGPMIAFGNTLAWGQYVIGIGVTLFVLTPLFGTNPLAGSLIEMSYEGGHGTAAGLGPTFVELGWSEGTDIALGLATLSLFASLLTGIILINMYHRRYKPREEAAEWEVQRQQLMRSGYDLLSLFKKIDAQPLQIAINVGAFVVAIGIGWVLLRSIIFTEDMLLRFFTDIRFFTHLPLFTLAMLGGLILQLTLKKINKQMLIQRRIVHYISTIALDFLIASAVSTISLSILINNFAVFLILGITGIVWILGSLFFFAPKFFKKDWFVYGITNVGQSMGMTATGLLMNRLVDPGNTIKAKESFAYKQLAFEPFMGGGLITAMAPIVIYEFGSYTALIIAFWVMGFWIGVGFHLHDKK